MITLEPQELLYGTKPMIPQPINISLSQTAAQLAMGNPVVVKLEPGDATHYCLLIVPAWADYVAGELGRYGIRPHTAIEYLIATQLHDQWGAAFYSHCLGTESYDLPKIENEWTREIFSWWFRHLWQAIAEKRANPHAV